jgi:hypothetical protein
MAASEPTPAVAIAGPCWLNHEGFTSKAPNVDASPAPVILAIATNE